MKKKYLIILLILVLGITTIIGCMPYKKASDVELRILQIADIQFETAEGMKDIDKAVLDKLIDSTAPDLIILTGDNSSSEQTKEYTLDVTQETVNYFDSKGIKWTTVFGNHDGLHKNTKKSEIYNIYKSAQLFIDTQEEWEGLEKLEIASEESEFSTGFNNIYTEGTYTNFSMPVRDDSGEILCNLLLLDTQSNNKNYYHGYSNEQIEFYNQQYNRLTEINNGERVPSLLFTHQPLTMYRNCYDNKDNADICTSYSGEIREPGNNIAYSRYNSAFEIAMLTNQDIKGVFVGHDHVNFFAGNFRPFEDNGYLTKNDIDFPRLSQSKINEIKGDMSYEVTLAFCRQSSYGLRFYPGMTNSFDRGARIIDIKKDGLTFETSDVTCTAKDDTFLKFDLKIWEPIVGKLK